MEVAEAKMAVKTHALVGTSNVGNFCLFSTGYLLKEVSRGKKQQQQFFFKDKHGEKTATRPASQFIFMR